MNNETKRDVLLNAVDALADAQASGGNVGHQDANLFMAEYDDALPDDLPVIPELIGKYLIMRKHDRGDLVQALDEGTSFLLDGTQWESVQDWFWFSDVKDSVDTFARAWLLGVWRVEETGEIVKLEAEK
ncbi:4Fe-4S ferredoxin, iron-sulfur binding [Lacticaseibacillus paracasei subsp. paracasei]|uniref:4Fe-4S ferredoxin, iron-sulfur binding n=1 Tax=Lacticaseibacillus paracasei subsp. paracasei TaxID=47714 RepID=A0AAP9KUY3_LACPA|nr:hypothetical protein [Lacticaseibacillus paracasei]QGV17503.1 4Fe-4S ferredoxin, iron-sulfur binding [Lacticaseibacillus paracasei subsp. paracasei]